MGERGRSVVYSSLDKTILLVHDLDANTVRCRKSGVCEEKSCALCGARRLAVPTGPMRARSYLFILNSLASGNYYTLDFEGGVSKFMGKCRLRKMLAAACETVGDEDVIVVGDWRFIDGEKGYIIMRML
jgi:hypothetical protein